MNEYGRALTDAMTSLARDDRVVFLGQAVACPGTAMSQTFANVPRDRLIEMPVAEDMQMGVALGMSLAGLVPVCCYPRFNFMLLALNQLVLHIDKLPLYSEYRPRVIVRVAVGTDDPMNPGPQHLGNYNDELDQMLDTVRVVSLRGSAQVLPEYMTALEGCTGSTVLVEYSRRYAAG